MKEKDLEDKIQRLDFRCRHAEFMVSIYKSWIKKLEAHIPDDISIKIEEGIDQAVFYGEPLS